MQALDYDVAAYPQHGGGTDDADDIENDRHALNQGVAHRGLAIVALIKGHANIVHLDQEANGAVDTQGQQDADENEGCQAHPEWLVDDLV